MKKLENFGDRVKYLRNLIKRSRKYLEEKYNFPEITQKKLEYNERNISQNYILKIINIYLKENLYVTENWLLTGNGKIPYFINSFNEDKSLQIKNYENNSNHIIKFNKFIGEIEEITKDCYPNSLIARTFKKDMEPIIFPGDYCIGWPILEKVPDNLIGEPCIVKIKKCNTLKIKIIKNIINEFEIQKINLSVSNIEHSDDESFTFNTEFDFISPIMCIIRKQKYEY